MSKPKRRGRPSLDSSGTPPASVHLKLSAKVYDHTYKARKNGESVQDVIRRSLTRLLSEERGGSI